MIRASAPVSAQPMQAAPAGAPFINTALAIVIVGALLACQILIGGTRLLFAFPAYGLLSLAGVLSLLALRGTRSLPDQICLLSAIVFFGYILVRAAYSPAAYLARFDIYSVAAGLIVYFLTATVVTDAKTRMLILVCLLVAALGHVIVGAIQFREGNNWMPIAFLQRFDYGRRASGFYICPNHLAGLLEVLGLFGLSLTFWSRWPVWAKLLIGYASMMCYIGIILTASRGGYLSVLVSLFVFVVLSLRIASAAGSALQVRIGTGALVLAVLAAISIFVVIHKNDYLSDRTKTVVDTRNIRLDFWRAALQQWKLSPLLGTGSRTYLFYGRQFRTGAVQMDPVYVHDDYLQLLAEYGLAGLAAFLPFLFLHLRRGLITARRIGPHRIVQSHRLLSNGMALNVGALSAVAAYAVHSVFDFNLHIPANLLLLAFVFGILANNGIEQGAGTDGPARKAFWWRIPAFALGVALGLQTWRLFPGEFYAEEARTALRDHRPLAAMSFASKGLAFEQQNPALYYYLGRSLFLAADTQRNGDARASFHNAALPAYESARVLAPLDETYWLELAFTFDSLKRFEEAEWMFGEARRLDPRSEAIHQYYQTHLQQWAGKESSATGTTPDPVGVEPGG